MSKLYLIKHAMPELDPNVPAPDWRLGARGRALSELLAQKLGAYPLDVIVSSVEPKAIETAQIVAARLASRLKSAKICTNTNDETNRLQRAITLKRASRNFSLSRTSWCWAVKLQIKRTRVLQTRLHA